MTFSLGEYQDIFLEEADEQLQELNQNLLALEKDSNDQEIINNIFRAAHSLKSSAAFVGLADLSDLAHKMENLLQGIRDKTMKVTPDIVDLLFQCFDVISEVIGEVAGGNPPSRDLTDIIDKITAVSNGESPRGSAPASAPREAQVEPDKIPLTPADGKQIKDGLQQGLSCSEVTVFIDPDAPMKSLKAQLILANLERVGNIVKMYPDVDAVIQPDFNNILQLVLLTSEPVEELRKACDVDQITRIDLRRIELVQKDNKVALRFSQNETILEDEEEAMDDEETASAPVTSETEPHEFEQLHEEDEKDESEQRADRRTPVLKTVKVSVDKLDQLLNNVGELVIANSGFYKLFEEMKRIEMDKSITGEFKNRMEQMSRIAKDLQSGIMKTRMVPIGQVFTRFNRLVRDLAKEFDKKVNLEIKGEETELDKKVIDVIGEPLMHLIRNAIDHGIETETERRQLKKKEMATVTLNAYQGGNQIFVEVSDDGCGLDVKEIKKKAIERGLATPEMVANMDREDVYNFIFNPGFSTSAVVTDISGRGVGMNVVRETVNELNGNVSIESEPGMGTRFILSFPLTLAIIPAIMVRVQKEMYAIPLSDVIETIKIVPEEITTIEGHEVINLRGEILSLLRLNRFVNIKTSIKKGEKTPVVVVGYGNRKIGLIVDYLEGKQEIVIKSLEQNYKTVPGLAGASILGDGSICLILDISSMINKVISYQESLSWEEKQQILEMQENEYEELAPEVDTVELTPGEEPSTGGEEEKPEADKEIIPPPPGDEKKISPSDIRASAPVTTGPEPVREDIVFQKEEPEPEPAEEPETEKKIEAGKAGEEPGRMEKAEVPEEETTGMPEEAGEAGDSDIEQRVKDALQNFRQELQDNVRSTLQGRDTEDHIRQLLDIDDSDLSRIQILANVGITEAAESLSRIIGKRVDLSIPEVSLLPIESIPEEVGDIDNVYIGVYMPMVGNIEGTILFSFREDTGFELIDLLFGLSQGDTHELNDDGESALKEITNIVGSAVVNAFSEKIEIAIKPTVPTIVHDYMQSILDSILAFHNMENEYALVMDTEFFHQDDKVIGKLLILPETDSLKKIVQQLRD